MKLKQDHLNQMKIFKYSQKYIHFFDFEEVTSNFELAYVFPCTICYQIDNICIINHWSNKHSGSLLSLF